MSEPTARELVDAINECPSASRRPAMALAARVEELLSICEFHDTNVLPHSARIGHLMNLSLGQHLENTISMWNLVSELEGEKEKASAKDN